MKKIIVLILTFTLVCLPAAVTAAEGADFSALQNQWETEGYPEDVGGIYFDSETGKFVVLLTEPSEQREDELRSMVSNPEIIDFGISFYSYNEMLAALEEIQSSMSAGSGINSAGLGWRADGEKVAGFGESGKEFRVVVTVDPKKLIQYSQDFNKKYGDMVYVEAGAAADLLGREDQPLPMFVLAGGLFIIALTVFMVYRRISLAQTSSGNVSIKVHLTKSDIENKIKNAPLSPDDSLLGRIHEQLNEKKDL